MRDFPHFPGYVAFDASLVDEMRVIWPRVREWGLATGELTIVLGAVREQVAQVNLSINKLITYKLENKWQSPAETWSLRSGDCKDYATLKRAVLLQRGLVAPDDTAIVIGEIRTMPRNLPHAWCAARAEGAWLVLDNKFDQLIRPEEYVNWTPLKACCGDDVVLYSRLLELSSAR